MQVSRFWRLQRYLLNRLALAFCRLPALFQPSLSPCQLKIVNNRSICRHIVDGIKGFGLLIQVGFGEFAVQSGCHRQLKRGDVTIIVLQQGKKRAWSCWVCCCWACRLAPYQIHPPKLAGAKPNITSATLASSRSCGGLSGSSSFTVASSVIEMPQPSSSPIATFVPSFMLPALITVLMIFRRDSEGKIVTALARLPYALIHPP